MKRYLNHFAVTLVAGLLFPALAFSEIEDLYLDAGGFAGYSTTINAKPELMQSGIGFTAGIWAFPEFLFAGITTDFRVINQYSSVTASGNMKGTRFSSFAPTVGARWKGMLLKLDAQLIGRYSMSSTTIGGADAAYRSPLGARLTGLVPVWERVHAGASLEYVTFGKVNEVVLNERIKQWNASLAAAYVF